jgi:hypothetical protein
VDDGVDVLLGDHLGDHRVADVGADERDVADVVARGYGVDADHPVDAGVGGEAAREPTPEVSGDPGDQDDLGCVSAHSVLLDVLARRTVERDLLSELASLDARLLQQLAMLLLRHPLATLLDDRTHELPLPTDNSDPGAAGTTRTA